MGSRCHRGRLAPALIAFLFLLGNRAGSQTVKAQLSGIVDDSSGGVVPDAKVTATNLGTRAPITTLTNGQGQYALPFLDPGQYEIRVEKQGFRPEVRSNVKLDPAQVAQINFTIQPGSLTSQVTVSAEGALLNTGSASLGTAIENAPIVDLPTNGRNPYGSGWNPFLCRLSARASFWFACVRPLRAGPM